MSEYTKNLNLFKYDPISDAKQPFDIQKALNENWDKIDQQSSAMPVGTIFAHTCSVNFVPENAVPADGTEYTEAQFSKTYNDWLLTGKLETCTFEEYQVQIDTIGECLKWALDTVNKKFKVPTKRNEWVTTNSDTIPVTGNGKVLGLTNGVIEKGFGLRGQDWGGVRACTVNTVDIGSDISAGLAPNVTELGGYIGVSKNAENSGMVAILPKIEIRYFVVIATSSIRQSEMDWSQWASSLQGKANIDLSNVNPYQDFINKSINWTMPDFSNQIDYSSAITVNNQLTLEYDCYAELYRNGAGRDVQFTYTIIYNGQTSVHYCSTKNENRWIFPLPKGAIIYTDGTAGLFIYPVIGENI